VKLLSLCDEVIVSFGSTFGAAAAAFGGKVPIYINLDDTFFAAISPGREKLITFLKYRTL
jgi:hypothetical protein